MTLSWKAIQIPGTEASLKAPTIRDHRDQLQEGWTPSRSLAEEVLMGFSMVQGIEAAGLRVPQGREYALWRYPQGLAVRTPSGWVLYQPSDSQVISHTQHKVEGEDRSWNS